MDTGFFLLLFALGGFLVWKMRKDQEPAIVEEVIYALRNHAEARHESVGAKYERMADALREAQAYAFRGDIPVPEEITRISSAIVGVTEPELLENLGFFYASGRRNRAQNALYSLMNKLK